MRIVLLNQFFWPDAVATSQILSDVAHDLAVNHDVIAICAESGATIENEESDLGQHVSIIRTKSASFGHRSSKRLLSYISYLVGSVWHGLRISEPDQFLTLTTPPVLPVIGSILSTLRGARHVIWEMDVYPDIATDIGFLKKGGIVAFLSGKLLDWSRRRAASIIVLGDDMKMRLLARGIPADKIRVVENWADGNEIQPAPFAPGPLVIHYSGNLGLAHEIDTIQKLIERLINHPDFQFTFVGGGPRRPALVQWCQEKGIRNVEFRSYCKRSDLSRSLGEGHLGLVTQLLHSLGSVVPSKIYGIMAAGRPLLYIGPDESTPARHIQRFQCGWHIQPGDVDGLESLLISLHENRQLLIEAGRRARTAFEQHFDRAIGVERIREVIAGHSLSQPLQPISASNESVIGD